MYYEIIKLLVALTRYSDLFYLPVASNMDQLITDPTENKI
jgi:hypothetical protein